ncbi:tail fiber-like protein [uncultured Mediterranean phage]|nr:tail fiber-like protein [uncultured Mediterranean phage]
MIDIDPDIEKQISLIQEEKLNSKIKEDIKKVVKVKEKPEEKLVDFFSIIASEKKQTKEKIIKSEKKIADIEELFSSLTKEKKKTKPKKELLLEPEKPKEEIKEEEQTVSEVLQDELEPIETDENVIGKVTKKLSEMKVANELDKDRLRTLDSITSLDEMKKEFVKFREVVTKQMGSIGGGGEVNLAKLDDVDTASALVDKRVLQYDGATGKFIGTTLETEDLVLNGTDASGSNAGDRLVMDGTDSSSSNAGDGIDLQDGTFGGTVDLSQVSQDILPDTTNSRNLGSATNRWNKLFLAGETIDLAGATISSDGTGAIAIAATGATLPAGSKAGDNELAVLQATTGGATPQIARLVPFFTNTGGLNTKNTDFEFNGTIDTRLVFTGSKTFTLANGSALQDSDPTIFQL